MAVKLTGYGGMRERKTMVISQLVPKHKISLQIIDLIVKSPFEKHIRKKVKASVTHIMFIKAATLIFNQPS